jgi:hypothetical protein
MKFRIEVVNLLRSFRTFFLLIYSIFLEVLAMHQRNPWIFFAGPTSQSPAADLELCSIACWACRFFPLPQTKMLAARRRLSAASTSPLLRRRLSAQTQPTASPAQPPPEVTDSGPGAWAGRAVALSLLGLTGAVAASAVSDLSVFLSCSRSNP